jgi:hypothetical protein
MINTSKFSLTTPQDAPSEGLPMKTVGNRANVTESVLSTHYDSRSEKEKMEQRRDYLDHI